MRRNPNEERVPSFISTEQTHEGRLGRGFHAHHACLSVSSTQKINDEYVQFLASYLCGYALLHQHQRTAVVFVNIVHSISILIINTRNIAALIVVDV